MKQIFIFIFATIILSFLACEKEREFQLVDQEFTLSRDTVIIQNSTFQEGFFIRVNAGVLNYYVRGLPGWVSVSNSQGQVGTSSTYIEFYLDTSKLPVTAESFVLSVETPIGTKKVFVLFIPSNGVLSFVRSEIKVNANSTSNFLPVFNIEPKPVSWSSTIDNAYITLNKTSGSLFLGGSDVLSIVVNKDKLPGNGTYISNITFTANGKTYYTQVTISNNLPSLTFDRDVKDAVFSRDRGEIIFVSTAPRSISRLNPVTNQLTSLNLNLVPLCVAVSYDGKKAVVGCDARVIVVDIENMTILNSYPIDGKAVNITYAPNDFAYIIPEKNGFVNLKELNLKTGIVKDNQQIIYTGSVGRLHPNGKWLYVADNSVSPTDVRKFTLADSGESTYLYDSPYHGDYNIGRGVWYTENGQKMLTGDVFLQCSSNASQDLKYMGSIQLPVVNQYKSQIWTAQHSAKNNVFYVSLIYQYNEIKLIDQIYVYDSESFDLINTLPLEAFTNENGNDLSPQPRFLFTTDNTLYVINTSQNEEKWALQKIGI